MSTVKEPDSSSPSIRFTLDDQVKTINRPVTGAALHVLAGSPAKLTVEGGGEVPNNHEPFDLKQDQKLVRTIGATAAPSTDKQETDADRKEKREAILDEVAAGHGGPYAEHPDHPGVEAKHPLGTEPVGPHERPSEHPKTESHTGIGVKKGRE